MTERELKLFQITDFIYDVMALACLVSFRKLSHKIRIYDKKRTKVLSS